MKNGAIDTKPLSEKLGITQYRLPMILFMFAWPIIWFVFLIYELGPMMLRSDGSVPTWTVILISLLGNGAELAAALIIFRCEGYRLSFSALRERINWHWPKSWKMWAAFVGVFVFAYSLAMLVSPTAQSIAKATSVPNWMPGHPLKEINSLQEGYPDINF